MTASHFGPVDALASRVEMSTRVYLVSLTIAILSTGCAAQAYQTYPGSKLPGNETARITADETPIISIDGKALPAGRAFMLRAGIHAVSATGTGGGLMTLCLAAEGGGSYQVRLGGLDRTVPEIYDVHRGSLAPTVLARVDENCASAPRGNTIVAVAVPTGARVHRGVPPPDTWTPEHEVISGPFAYQMLVELPLKILWGTLYVIALGI
jgi:hypothetical protein